MDATALAAKSRLLRALVQPGRMQPGMILKGKDKISLPISGQRDTVPQWPSCRLPTAGSGVRELHTIAAKR